MTTFYFTFGIGSPLAKYYVAIEATDEVTARLHMNCLFTQHWSSVYRDLESVTRHGLTRLNVNLNADIRLGTNHNDIPIEQYHRVYGGIRVGPHA